MNDNERYMLKLGYDLVAAFCGTEERVLTVKDVKKIIRYAETVYDERCKKLGLGNRE